MAIQRVIFWKFLIFFLNMTRIVELVTSIINRLRVQKLTMHSTDPTTLSILSAKSLIYTQQFAYLLLVIPKITHSEV